MTARDDADAIIGEAMRAAQAAIMKLERFSEQLHEANTARAVAEAPDVEAIGALYVAHLRCCWGEQLDTITRERVRELKSIDFTVGPPF